MADLTITAANVLAGSGSVTETGIAGATIAAGDVLYADASDSGKLKLADNNASAATAVVAGIALHGSASGQPIKYLTAGPITLGSVLTVAQTYVLSDTAGKIMPIADLDTAGMYATHLGIATTTSSLSVLIRNSGVAVPA